MPKYKKSSRTANNRRVTTIPLEYKLKRIQNRLNNLEKDNINDSNSNVKNIDIMDNENENENDIGVARHKRRAVAGKTSNVRNLLTYSKTFQQVIDDNADTQFLNCTLLTNNNSNVGKKLCQPCGYWGLYRCLNCDIPYCSLSCLNLHNEHCDRK